MIGDGIVVTIVDLVGDRVRFGVNAPKNMAVVKEGLADQGLRIGHKVTVTVVDVRGDKVRIGVVCPREMSVHRLEVYEAIRNENARAREDLAMQDSPPPRNPAKALCDDIASALVMKFSEAAEPLIDEIRQIRDVNVLERIAKSVESATTLDEVRRVWSG